MSISKESIENPMLTKKQFKFWFDQLKKLDISKSEQRQKLVDLFVNSIIIYDDKIKFFFNYKKSTKTITFDELNNCSDLPDSPRPKGSRTFFGMSCFLFCLFTRFELATRGSKCAAFGRNSPGDCFAASALFLCSITHFCRWSSTFSPVLQYLLQYLVMRGIEKAGQF